MSGSIQSTTDPSQQVSGSTETASSSASGSASKWPARRVEWAEAKAGADASGSQAGEIARKSPATGGRQRKVKINLPAMAILPADQEHLERMYIRALKNMEEDQAAPELQFLAAKLLKGIWRKCGVASRLVLKFK